MANPSTTNVIVGKARVTGGVSYAPLGTPLPTDATSPLDAAFTRLGYVSKDGVKRGIDSKTEDEKAWGGDTIASILSEDARDFSFELVSAADPDVLKAVFGADNVVVTAEGTISVKETSQQVPQAVYVFDVAHNGKQARMIAPVGSLTLTGERDYVDDAVMGYEVKVSCLSDENGVKTYRYFAV